MGHRWLGRAVVCVCVCVCKRRPELGDWRSIAGLERAAVVVTCVLMEPDRERYLSPFDWLLFGSPRLVHVVCANYLTVWYMCGGCRLCV